MSLAVVFCTPHGIVMGADHCITIKLADNTTFCHSMQDQKLFLASNGYGFCYTGDSTFREFPASYWMERLIPRFADLDLSVAEFTRKLCVAFHSLDPKKTIYIVGTGYDSGNPQVYYGNSMDRIINNAIDINNTCLLVAGEEVLGTRITDAIPIERTKYTIPDAIDFIKHVILTVSNIQKFGNVPVTVGPDCDILVVTKDVSGWIEPPVFNLSS